MGYNLNRLSGAVALFFLGGSGASMTASFLFRANYDDITGGVFQIVGAVLLMLGALLVFVNSQGESSKENSNVKSIVNIILLLTIITAVVMTILGESVRF